MLKHIILCNLNLIIEYLKYSKLLMRQTEQKRSLQMI